MPFFNSSYSEYDGLERDAELAKLKVEVKKLKKIELLAWGVVKAKTRNEEEGFIEALEKELNGR